MRVGWFSVRHRKSHQKLNLLPPVFFHILCGNCRFCSQKRAMAFQVNMKKKKQFCCNMCDNYMHFIHIFANSLKTNEQVLTAVDSYANYKIYASKRQNFALEFSHLRPFSVNCLQTNEIFSTNFLRLFCWLTVVNIYCL